MKTNQVIIVEDDAALRKSLSDWLSPKYITSSFDSAEAFLTAINEFEFENGIPTCILLDFQMPGMNGVELQSNLKSLNIECPIIFMSGNAQQIDIINAWHGGAIDFLLKPFTGNQISDVLTAIFKKVEEIKIATPPLVTEEALIDIPISQREANVLLLLGKGYRQNEVADMLGITLRTVKMHRANLKHKLNLNTLVELTRYFDKYKLSIEKIIFRN